MAKPKPPTDAAIIKAFNKVEEAFNVAVELQARIGGHVENHVQDCKGYRMKKPKPPTDAAIIKAFNKFEEAFNVADELLRDFPEVVYPQNLQAAETDRDNLFRAHRVMHYLADGAYKRKEAKHG